MARKNRLTDEQRVRAVQEYLAGNGSYGHIARKYGIAYQHIPPRAAFNFMPSKPVSGIELIKDDNRMPWETSGIPYFNQQQGMGEYSLCKDCNNNTGSWYGDSYVDFANIVHSVFLAEIPQWANSIRVHNIYPLRIIKQVVSMFCSINNQLDDSSFDSLRKFVLTKELAGIDKEKYTIYMYFTQSGITKFVPKTGILNISSQKIDVVSEITAYPLGFVLLLEPKRNNPEFGVDITEFSNCKYDDMHDVEIPLCIRDMNDIFPACYRTKEEIIKCVEDTQKYKESHKIE